jgi:hypothetical protein
MSGRARRRARPRRGAARWSARVSIVVGAAAVLFAVLAPAAGANYGRISARVACDRTVSWTASASTEGEPQDRINSRVAVDYRAMKGTAPIGGWRSAGAEGRFDPSNDFEFSGSFELPDAADAVDLRVTPLAAWGPQGGGDPAGGPRFSRAELPSGCADQPLVADVALDCANGGGRVSLRNVGETAAEATVSSDGVPVRTAQLEADGSYEVIVPLLPGRASTVRVASGDFVIAESTIDDDCGISGPAAVVVERCANRQAVLLATAGDRPDAQVEVRLAGTLVESSRAPAGEVLQRTFAIPPGGPAPVEVLIDDSPVAAGEVGGCDGPVAGAVTCGVGGRTPCQGLGAPGTTLPEPPPPPPPATLELAEPFLPQTGPWERALVLLLGGGLLLAGGLALAGHDRSRPVPSALGAALAPYRQRWWED